MHEACCVGAFSIWRIAKANETRRVNFKFGEAHEKYEICTHLLEQNKRRNA
jgi:hypothetical protein